MRAQSYDPVAQAWGPVTTVHRSRTPCSWGNNFIETPLAVLAAVLRCGDSNVVLTTRDGLAWRALRMGEQPLGNSPDGPRAAVQLLAEAGSRQWLDGADRAFLMGPDARTARQVACRAVVRVGGGLSPCGR